VCKYHNFHNHFDANIRNANFGKESPIFYVNDSTLVTRPPVYALEPNDVGHYHYSIQMDRDVTEILIAFRNLSNDEIQHVDYKGEYSVAHNAEQYVHFTLKANGKTLVEKYGWELLRDDYSTSGVELQDKNNVSNGLVNFQSLRSPNNHLSGPLIDNVTGTLGLENTFRKASSLYVIPMTLLGTDLFYNGALCTDSLANFTLDIRGQSLEVEQVQQPLVFDDITPSVVLRHKKIVRIDSKTGVVG
jgi:hypothetical protein